MTSLPAHTVTPTTARCGGGIVRLNKGLNNNNRNNASPRAGD